MIEPVNEMITIILQGNKNIKRNFPKEYSLEIDTSAIGYYDVSVTKGTGKNKKILLSIILESGDTINAKFNENDNSYNLSVFIMQNNYLSIDTFFSAYCCMWSRGIIDKSGETIGYVKLLRTKEKFEALKERVTATETKVQALDAKKADITYVDQELEKKVTAVDGKGLSEENFTAAEKEKLANLENYDDTELVGTLASLDKQQWVNSWQ